LAARLRGRAFVAILGLWRYRLSLLHAICTDPSILAVSEYDRLAPVTSYMREHFGTRVSRTNVDQGSFGAWRCSRADDK
jgi:hypothetical protein